ncbi:hypothetical protein [Rhizobium sp. RU35A]|uniref:hypothetical protein n=1 Tax=Rhizobium sp. RU35A TaxID=1907414 RepID=UPI00122C6BD5|nr:hypothetical protein [Rhizobium sp. RU35A]
MKTSLPPIFQNDVDGHLMIGRRHWPVMTGAGIAAARATTATGAADAQAQGSRETCSPAKAVTHRAILPRPTPDHADWLLRIQS